MPLKDFWPTKHRIDTSNASQRNLASISRIDGNELITSLSLAGLQKFFCFLRAQFAPVYPPIEVRKVFISSWLIIFNRMHVTLQHALTMGWLVGHVLLFFVILFFWPHCSCPNGLVTSNMAPAHLHATLIAVYPALHRHITSLKKPL